MDDRRPLWQDLIILDLSIRSPWCVMGYYNVVVEKEIEFKAI